MREFCPYCYQLSRVSKDHIFSRFFGGRAWIKACKTCNNIFGHSFEGKSINELVPIIVVLGINGLKPMKKLVWRNAFISHGVSFDLDSNNKSVARLQKAPTTGKEVLRLVTTQSYTGLLNNLTGKFHSRNFRITNTNEEITVQKILLPPTVLINSDTHRLVIKMCIGLLSHFGIYEVMSTAVQQFLLTGNGANSPVFMDFRQHDEIDAFRKDLSHVVYVQASSKDFLCYGLIQLFGFLQLYVVLNDDYHGPRFAFAGLHNSLTHEETFSHAVALGIQPPDRTLPHDVAEAGCKYQFGKLNAQIVRVFGKADPFFDMSVLQLHGKTTSDEL